MWRRTVQPLKHSTVCLRFFDHLSRHLTESEWRVQLFGNGKCELMANFSTTTVTIWERRNKLECDILARKPLTNFTATIMVMSLPAVSLSLSLTHRAHFTHNNPSAFALGVMSRIKFLACRLSFFSWLGLKGSSILPEWPTAKLFVTRSELLVTRSELLEKWVIGDKKWVIGDKKWVLRDKKQLRFSPHISGLYPPTNHSFTCTLSTCSWRLRMKLYEKWMHRKHTRVKNLWMTSSDRIRCDWHVRLWVRESQKVWLFRFRELVHNHRTHVSNSIRVGHDQRSVSLSATTSTS